MTCGFFLGLSIFAPGFSGSIIAIIMGIYPDLINVIAQPFKKIKENIIFCLPISIGAILSGILFILTFNLLFDSYIKATYLLFAGLIIGNIPIIFREIKKYPWEKKFLLYGCIAFFSSLILSIWAIGINQNTDVLNINLILLAISGIIAGTIVFIPGMSISMVLIIMGVYSSLIHIAESFIFLDFRFIIPFSIFLLGTLIGIIITAKGIKHILDNHQELSNWIIFGFMGGSLSGLIYEIFKINDGDFNLIFGIVMLSFGLSISAAFLLIANKFAKFKKD